MKEIGDIISGRPNLGQDMPVVVYRLFELAVMEVLTEKFGNEESDNLIREAGFRAGTFFASNFLNMESEINDFVSDFQNKLAELRIGILRIEKIDMEAGDILLSVYEDLDCSGMPVSDEQICVYDEGFIAGVLKKYSGIDFNVREIDCWASGERVCRFRARAK